MLISDIYGEDKIMKKIKRVMCAALAAVQAVGLITVGAFAADKTTVSRDTIAAGDSHSLVIKSDLSLWAAGDNKHGQLGAGASIDNTDGVKVMDNIIFVDAVGETSFAIDGSGTLYGWGDNTKGQILPTKVENYIYTPTKLMDNVAMVSAGESHTVAITTDGTAYGWGSNEEGELGFAANSAKNSIRKLMENVVDAAAGEDFTFLLTSDGKLFASGDNSNGQFGTGNYRSSNAFGALAVTDVQSVDAGSGHVLLMKNDGTVYAAGLNDNHQVCADEKTRVNSFTKLNMSGAAAIFAGERSSAALKADGKLYGWGDNDCGQLLNGTTDDIVAIKKVDSDVISVAFGGYHSIVLKSNGIVASAGEGMHGELFRYQDSAVIKPERIMENVTKYSAGTDHAAAISDGQLYTWGNNDCGQLGLGDMISRSEPVRVQLPAIPINVWCGNKYTIVQTNDLKAYVFGSNANNVLGLSSKYTNVTEPTENVMLSDYEEMKLACSKDFCIALLDGAVFGWGKNVSGRLCDNGKVVDQPTILSDQLIGIVEIAAGDNHCLALDSSGYVWGWGGNGSDQIGSGTDEVFSDIPISIEFINPKTGDYSTAEHIDAAGSHSIAVTDDGKVWVWGGNSLGQLGVEGYRISDPKYVGYTGEKVATGRYACAIIDEAEKLMLCGINKSGALGDGTETDRTTFGKGTANSAESVDIGEYFGGYIRTDGTLFCWGDNSVGQVGNGKGGISIKPMDVITDALCTALDSADKISLNKSEIVLKPNAKSKLIATITPADAEIKTIKWTSSNIKVATVAADGTVTAKAKGEAVITATALNGVSAQCKVKVTIPVSSFSVSPKNTKTMGIGKTFTFKTKIYPSTAIDKTLLFESSDPDVATVTAKGKVKAVSAGVATITITAKSNPDKVKQVTVYVRPAKTKFSSRKATEDGVLLKWKQTSGADGYTVYRRTSANGKSTVVADIGADETLACLDTNAKSGKTYYYFIKAYVEENGKKIYASSYSVYKIKAK